MKSNMVGMLGCILLSLPNMVAQEINYDEDKIPAFTLPDPLICNDGTRVTTPQQWQQHRRPEILQLFKDHVYGVMPPSPSKENQVSGRCVNEQVIEVELDPAADSKETVRVRMKEVDLYLQGDPAGPVAHLIIFFPPDRDSTPLFLGYNFEGNHTLLATPQIHLHDTWKRDGSSGVPDESTRGRLSSRWPIGLITSKGFGLATLHYGDIDPDFDDGFKNGVHPLFPELQNRPDNWASIGAWAWGLARVMDYLETDPAVVANQVAVIGHSRLGKTALWAGATDERFAMVVSNDSGCGGAALARRRIGETVARINTVFPHWFCQRHKEYNDHEDQLPVDQHMLIGLIAPRPCYIASAIEDRWADPRGEFLAAYAAGPVYALFGNPGLGLEKPDMPPVDSPIGGTIGYHVRSGQHDLTRYDWQQFLAFADRHFNH